MFKLLFEIITNPLSLPIPFIWEYLILFIIYKIAFKIGWKVSPGGKFGSEIHWVVRTLSFIIIWVITYGIIILVKWICVHWILILSIIGGIIAIIGSWSTW